MCKCVNAIIVGTDILENRKATKTSKSAILNKSLDLNGLTLSESYLILS